MRAVLRKRRKISPLMDWPPHIADSALAAAPRRHRKTSRSHDLSDGNLDIPLTALGGSLASDRMVK